MSPRVARYLAVPFGLLAAAPFFVRESVHLQGMASTIANGLMLLGSLVVPLALYLLVIKRYWRLPNRLTADSSRKRLVASASPAIDGGLFVIQLALSAMVFTGPAPNIGIPLGSIFAAWSVIKLFLERPWVALTTDSLTIQYLTKRAVIPWNELAAGEPLPPQRKGDYVTLRTKGGKTHFVPGWILMDSTVLADTIRHYVDNPGARAAIVSEL